VKVGIWPTQKFLAYDRISVSLFEHDSLVACYTDIDTAGDLWRQNGTFGTIFSAKLWHHSACCTDTTSLRRHELLPSRGENMTLPPLYAIYEHHPQYISMYL